MTSAQIKKTILLLEDEMIQQKMMGYILSGDYYLQIVANGREAFSWLKSNNLPDLIIMDWIMPQMDGKTFLYEFKKEKEFSNIPIIVLSSYEDVNKEISEIPYIPYQKMVKPVEPNFLKKSIQEVLF